MRFHLRFFIHCSFIILLFGGVSSFYAQQAINPVYGKQSNALVKLLEKFHYNPPVFDKVFSEKVYLKFIHQLDPRGLYLTLEDLRVLNEYKNKLDDEVGNCSPYFLDVATRTFRAKLQSTDTLVSQMLRKPTDFAFTDTIFYTKSDSITYTANEKGLQRRWRRYLKYEVLVNLYTAEDSDKVNPFSLEVKDLLKKEPVVRAKILRNTQRKIRRILNHPDGFENFIATEYLNAIASSYDPHTEFFSDSGKNEFVSELSSDEYSFGISLEENENGDPEITHLVPGGAAWKSNLLNDGDILLKIKTLLPSVHDLPFTDITQVLEILGFKANKNLELTVRKRNGQIRTVQLEKTRVRSDENAIKSYLLNGEKKIGYISLPSFYTEWGTSSPLGCANDVAKEIIKLQEEHIDGLILDLRSNGGGSVYEAIGLAGLFIDEGPISVFKERNAKPQLLKDMNRGTAYDGPLLVMVNGMSASASELFAGGIQDYNRGLIVGSATYGKASGQTIFPVDSIYSFPELFSGSCVPGKADQGKMGYAKITVEKFYNLHDGSHQLRGIKPDVALPDPFYYNAYRESFLPGALPNDSVYKKVIFHPFPPLPISELSFRSAGRLKKNKSFLSFHQLNDSLQYIQQKEGMLILKPENYRREEKKSHQLTEAMEKLQSESTGMFKAENNSYEEQLLGMDSYSKEANALVLQNLQKDIFLGEAFNIIGDLISLHNK